MPRLTFTGTDFQSLFDLLIQAVKMAHEERPSITVNGKTYPPFDLLKVADLLPDDDLSPEHQAIIDTMFDRKQRGYRRTGYNLAHRANQIASEKKMAVVRSRTARAG